MRVFLPCLSSRMMEQQSKGTKKNNENTLESAGKLILIEKKNNDGKGGTPHT